MTPSSISEVQRFNAVLVRRLGLAFDESKLLFLSQVLQRQVDSTGESCDRYLERLEGDGDAEDELRRLGQELTVSETYFFRNIEQFNALEQLVLPARINARGADRRISLLSAGCASGEEPYSLAIVAQQVCPRGWNVTVRAADINAGVLDKARKGRYSPWALRETPAEKQRTWFHPVGREFQLLPTLLDAVRFDQRNLAAEDPELWQPEAYDIVFCRNVLMYFSPEQARALVHRITRSLVPGGYLFLGHAETLRGLSSDFHLCHTHQTFYYRRKARISAPQQYTPELPMQRGAPSTRLPPDWTAAWLETVERASSRIEALATTTPLLSTRTSDLTPAQTPHVTSSLALQLLEEERFSEALEVLQALPEDQPADPDSLLLRAVLLTHCGQFVAAEQACIELLARDELSSGAHYLLALCREGQCDVQGAVDHDQNAIYLDPSFAMPRLHLGLLARRSKDDESARRELSQALNLLQREDAARVVFFGGGFNREALVALCRAELRAAGGTP